MRGGGGGGGGGNTGMGEGRERDTGREGGRERDTGRGGHIIIHIHVGNSPVILCTYVNCIHTGTCTLCA